VGCNTKFPPARRLDVQTIRPRRAAGFDLHLTKPIDLRTLDQLLAAL
jgi:hypothetical protein